LFRFILSPYPNFNSENPVTTVPGSDLISLYSFGKFTENNEMLKNLVFVFIWLFITGITANGQPAKPSPAPTPAASPALAGPKKANERAPAKPQEPAPEPFDKADVKTLAGSCVQLDTEAGLIELEMFPESAPETVRNFLNLAATGAFDTTTFSRVVPNFIIQGGNLYTSEKMTGALGRRAHRTIPDEPSKILHEKGIVSMARGDEPNAATTDFFILLGPATHLDGKFAAFGRVIKGIEVAEAINKMPGANEKPEKPVKIKKASVSACTLAP
jgi:peptidyl-prolyl cis-trans isomerase B (cyclophilin B)